MVKVITCKVYFPSIKIDYTFKDESIISAKFEIVSASLSVIFGIGNISQIHGIGIGQSLGIAASGIIIVGTDSGIFQLSRATEKILES